MKEISDSRYFNMPILDKELKILCKKMLILLILQQVF